MDMDNNLWQEKIRTHLRESAELKTQVSQTCASSILTAANLIIESYRNGGKVLLCGNGGSAADCQHMAAELVSRLTKDFDRPGLPAIALTTDTSIITAYANDCGFDGVFERQVQALGRKGDVLIGISTSGKSVNITRAVNAAHDLGMKTLGLLGGNGPLNATVDVAVLVPSSNTQYVQEALLSVEHILCGIIEQVLFAQGDT